MTSRTANSIHLDMNPNDLGRPSTKKKMTKLVGHREWTARVMGSGEVMSGEEIHIRGVGCRWDNPRYYIPTLCGNMNQHNDSRMHYPSHTTYAPATPHFKPTCDACILLSLARRGEEDDTSVE